MHSQRLNLPFSFMSLALGSVLVLLVAYIGLIAVVMSYAALTVEFSQSVRDDESAVAELESEYFARISRITSTDYAALGYQKPTSQLFVRAESATALR